MPESNVDFIARIRWMIQDMELGYQPNRIQWMNKEDALDACDRIEQLEKEAQLVTPDQNEMQILKERISFYQQTESKRNEELEGLYAAATKALNTQIEITNALEAKIKQLQEQIKILTEDLALMTESYKTHAQISEDRRVEIERLEAELKQAETAYHEMCGGYGAELKKYRWMPVNKGLPKAGQFCHLYMPEFNSNCPQRGWYLPDKKVWLTTVKSHYHTRKVTHWQPIMLPDQALKGQNETYR